MNNFFNKNRVGHRAFSLVELLTVLAITSVMAALTVPAISGLTEAGKMNYSTSAVSSVLDLARQYAIAQNTYVWVAFCETPSSSTQEAELSIAIISSKDGTDSAGWSSTNSVPNSNFDLVSKIQTLSQLQISGADQLNFTGLPKVNQTQENLSDAVTFLVNNPRTSQVENFNHVIQFKPNGEARVGGAPVRSIELGLQMVKGTVANTKNVAVIRIAGLTGTNRLYRP